MDYYFTTWTTPTAEVAERQRPWFDLHGFSSTNEVVGYYAKLGVVTGPAPDYWPAETKTCTLAKAREYYTRFAAGRVLFELGSTQTTTTATGTNHEGINNADSSPEPEPEPELPGVMTRSLRSASTEQTRGGAGSDPDDNADGVSSGDSVSEGARKGATRGISEDSGDDAMDILMDDYGMDDYGMDEGGDGGEEGGADEGGEEGEDTGAALTESDMDDSIAMIPPTFDPSTLVDNAIAAINEAWKTTENRREELEGERRSTQIADANQNLDCQKAYTAGQDAMAEAPAVLSKSASAMEDLTPGTLKNPLAGDSYFADANAPSEESDVSESMAEAIGEACEAGENGECPGADTVAAIAESVADGTASPEAMQAVFSDSTGKTAEASTEATMNSDKPVKRGNGPCGPGTKSVGGVNYDEAENGEENAQEKAVLYQQLKKACQSGNVKEVNRIAALLTDPPVYDSKGKRIGGGKFGEPKATVQKVIDDNMKSSNRVVDTAPQTPVGTSNVKNTWDTYGIDTPQQSSYAMAKALYDGDATEARKSQTIQSAASSAKSSARSQNAMKNAS